MKRGDVWLINLDPTIGAEIRKVRPAIIISHDDLGILPLKIIVPITEWKDRYSVVPWMVKILPNDQNGLAKMSAADTLQIRSVSIERFLRKAGSIESNIMIQVELSLGNVLNI